MEPAITQSNASGEPRSVDAGRGLAWWSEAWAVFMKSAGIWIVLAIIMLVIFIVLAFIPLLGGLVLALVLPVFIGSWLLAARKVEDGGTLEAGDLFAAFKGASLTPLLVVGGLLLAGALVIGLVVGAMGLGAIFGVGAGAATRSGGGMFAALGVGMLAVLLGLVLGLVLTMATWFAPALVVFQNRAPMEAIKASFAASLKNIVPFLLWGVIYIGASIVASIPFGLGWIVLGPVLMLTAYTSYKDVFGL